MSSSDAPRKAEQQEPPLVRPITARAAEEVHLSAWALPDFDLPEEIEAAQPDHVDAHAEMLEKARQEAVQAGFAEGRAKGEKAGFTAGHAEGLAAAAEEQAQIRQRFQGWLQSLAHPLAEMDAEVSLQLSRLAAQMARAIIYRELTITPEQLDKVARDAIAALPVAVREITLVCHPDESDALREAVDQNDLHDRQLQRINIRADATVTPGGLLVESNTPGAASIVDASLEARWAALCLRVLDEQVAGPADPISDDNQASNE